MQKLSLSKNRFALVDDCDYHAVIAMGKWHINSSEYAILYSKDLNGKRVVLYLHRVVMQLVLGRPVGQMQVDHINADRLNCCRDNLRLATASENQAAKGNQVNSTSGQKGITKRYSSSKFDVRIRYYHHRLHLGRYADFDLAVSVYTYAHRLLWGEFTSEIASDVPLPSAVRDKINQQIAAVLKPIPPL